MHETSLMAILLKRVAEELSKAGASRATSIRIGVGALAGVDPCLLTVAFQQFSTGTPAEGARLEVATVPLTALCEACGARFTVEQFRFHCSICGSGRTRVIAGEQVILESLTVVAEREPEGARMP